MIPLTLGTPGSPLTILCIGAHSDDIEIGAGGTLLRLLADHPRSVVHWVVGSATGERAAEAKRSAAAFTRRAAAMHLTLHRFSESHFPVDWQQIKQAFEALKPIAPDLVLTHHRHDDHQDHRVLGELAWNTFRDQLIAEFEIPKYEGDLGRPNLYVPLTTADANLKIELLLEHFGSQRSRRWFRAETFLGLMAVRGVECNAADGWAEAFHCRKVVL
jgi:LmbE family N-acetylglucosaminyl deacetylase